MTATPPLTHSAPLFASLPVVFMLALACSPSAATPPAESPRPVTLDDVLSALGRGEALSTHCFARSLAGRPACAVGSASIQGIVVRSIVLLADEPGVFVYYESAEGEQSLEVDPSRIDHDALAAARAALDEEGFTPWTEGDQEQVLAPNTQIGLGSLGLMRRRTPLEPGGDSETGTWTQAQDELVLQCSTGPRALELDALSFGNPYSAADVRVYPIRGGLRLLTARVTWSIEGDAGSASDVALMDPATACD